MADNDRRVKRTQKVLLDAMVAVSLEKGYDSVTIKDITERADVAYSTFFRHYRDKDELLLTMLGATLETLQTVIQQNPDSSPESTGHILFEHVQQNARFYKVLFSSQSTSPVLARFRRRVEDDILQSRPMDSARLAVPLALTVHQMVASIVTLVAWWLNNDMPYSVEQMARFYGELIEKPLAHLLNYS